MADSGIDDILVLYPIVGAQKLVRLISLAERVRCSVSLDSFEVAEGISRAAVEAGVVVGLRVEFDTGFGRIGLPISTDGIETALRIHDLPGFRWEGILTYPGHIMGTADERMQLVAGEDRKVSTIVELLAARGVKCPIVSGGNTPAAFLCHEFRNITEIRPGTYIFNDKNTVCAEAVTYEDCALSVISTVVSVSVSGKAMIDAGIKTLSADALLSGDQRGYGRVIEYPEVTVEDLSEEHGHLNLRASDKVPKLGERLRVIPNHVCTCVNLHDQVYGCCGDVVVFEWQVRGRGKVQ